MTTIRLEGLDKLKRKLEPGQYRDALKAGLAGAAEIIRDEVAQYPPATAANRSPGVNGYSWYERGYGTHTITGQSYPTSQMLGRSWTTKVEPLRAIIGNRVSYGPYVQDEEAQAHFHKIRGWKTIQTVAEQKAKDVVEFIESMFRKALRG